jgi:hypothetical protein
MTKIVPNLKDNQISVYKMSKIFLTACPRGGQPQGIVRGEACANFDSENNLVQTIMINGMILVIFAKYSVQNLS